VTITREEVVEWFDIPLQVVAAEYGLLELLIVEERYWDVKGLEVGFHIIL
jgi:hypothetical protein